MAAQKKNKLFYGLSDTNPTVSLTGTLPMSNYKNQTAFQEHVTKPLKQLVGTALRAVEYYALDCDMPEFDAGALTASGCQGVHLVFDGGEVEVDWGNLPELRDPTGFFAYHLVVRTLLERRGPEQLHWLTPVDATSASPWTTVIGEPLQSVSALGTVVEGCRAIPQAVEFTFLSGNIFATIGWPGQLSEDAGTRSIGECSIGDGDEVLVFSSDQWARLQPEYFMAGGFPVPLWTAPKENLS